MEWLGIYLILGGAVGVMAGLFGIGGGGVLVPAFVSIFLAQGMQSHLVMHYAIATSMACILVTSFASMRAHSAKGTVQWPIVKSMAPWIILGTFAATFIATALSAQVLAGIFSLFMLSVAIKMLRQTSSGQVHDSKSLTPSSMGIAGLGIGAVSALVSIGGGSLTVPYLSNRGIEIKHAIGTSAAIGLPIAIAASLGYWVNGLASAEVAQKTASGGIGVQMGAVMEDSWWQVAAQSLDMSLGFIAVPAAVCVAFGSYFSAPYGVLLAHKLPVGLLKKLFACLLIILSLKMFSSLV
jgi:uncharacterized protein